MFELQSFYGSHWVLVMEQGSVKPALVVRRVFCLIGGVLPLPGTFCLFEVSRPFECGPETGPRSERSLSHLITLHIRKLW